MKQDRKAWTAVAGLWVILVLLGSTNAITGIFYGPVSHDFHTTRAAISLLSGLFALGMGVGSVVTGWLIGVLGTRRVMIAGALTCGICFVLCSRAVTFDALVFYYMVAGFGAGLCTFIPVSLIVGNWFGGQAGLAMGITMTGTTLGASLMAQVVNNAILRWGWRGAFLTLATPVFLLAIPLIAILQSAPGADQGGVGGQRVRAAQTEGLEVGQALRTREFWFVSLCQFFCGYIGIGLIGHLVVYLQGLGYPRAYAAASLSAILALTAVGKIALGYLANRAGARWSVAIGFLLEGTGLVLLMGAIQTAMLAAGIVCYGLSWGAPFALMPLLMIDSFGLKRYAAIAGLTSIPFNIGNTLGPLATGRLFDLTGNYYAAFLVMVVLAAIGVVAGVACRPLGKLLELFRSPAEVLPAA